MRRLIASLLFFVSAAVCAADGTLLGPDRANWPDTEFRKTRNDFAAVLLVTPDLDWQAKWNTPPDTIPRFREASLVRVGQELVILTFFVNPATDGSGMARVNCSIKVTRPNKSVSVDLRDIPCLDGQLKGDPNWVRLSPAVIRFVGEKADPRGEWIVDVEVEDVLRKTKLPLRTRFTLLDNV